jgi:hypothetical protein
VVTERSSNPVWNSVTVRLVDQQPDIVESTLTLIRGVRRLDITNRILKVGTPEKESMYFAFPFDVRDPSLHYEITGGIDSPDAPHVPGRISKGTWKRPGSKARTSGSSFLRGVSSHLLWIWSAGGRAGS